MLSIEISRSKEVPGIYSCYLKFSEFNQSWIEIIRNFHTRKYHVEEKMWEFPFYQLQSIIERYQNVPIQIHFKKEPHCEYIPVPEIDLKRPLFEHQKIAVEYGINNPKYLLLDTMGLGKTTSVIAEAIALKKLGKITQCLIICCVSDLQYNWEREIKTVCNESCFILGTRYKKNGKPYSAKVSDRVDDLKTHKEFFLITNKETLQNEKFIKILTNGYKTIPSYINFMTIDEFHKGTGNPNSISGKNLQKLNEIDYIIPMSGTILRNKPFDAWAPLTLIGKEHATYGQFRNYYSMYGDYHEVTKYRNLEHLQKQLAQCSLRRTRKDVKNDIPDKIFKKSFVRMNERQQLIYDEVYSWALANIDLISGSPNPLAQLIRLRQATGFTGILSTTIKESAKLDMIEEDVADIIENDEKVLIFSNWTDITDELIRRLSSKYKILSITGNTIHSGREVEEVKYKFNNMPEYKILIGTTGKMGTGHDLPAASWVLFADEPWTQGDKDQAIDRTQRPGQLNNVTIVTYLTEGTIDEQVNKLVESKGDMANFLVDGIKPIERTKLTKFLLGLGDENEL